MQPSSPDSVETPASSEHPPGRIEELRRDAELVGRIGFFMVEAAINDFTSLARRVSKTIRGVSGLILSHKDKTPPRRHF